MDRNALRTLFFVVALSACSPPDTPTEDEVSLEASDFFERGIKATRAGPIVSVLLGSELSAELAPASQRYLFSFALSAPAHVALRTSAVVAGPEVDTVLALYLTDDVRRTRRKVAENDDAEGTRFSALDRELAPGSYLLEVRGFRARTRGPFALVTSCDGPGCPVLPAPCPFGEQFSDLRDHPNLVITSERWITSDTQLVSDAERAELVIAVQQSSHTDVRTPSEALSRVDEQKVRQLAMQQRGGSATYVVYEYGVGDNSYGAIFATDALEVLASIHDGDLLDCRSAP